MKLPYASKISFLGLFLLVLAIQNSSAQGYLNKKLYPGMNRRMISSSTPMNHQIVFKWTYYGGLGIATYFGELCENGDCFNRSNYAISAGLKYRFNNHFVVGGGLRTFKISGSDGANGSAANGRAFRDLSFVTDGLELNVFGQVDILPLLTSFRGSMASQFTRRRPIIPYGFAGFSLLTYSPKTLYKDVWYDLRDIKTEKDKSYSAFTPVISYGLGVRFKALDYLDLGLEASYNLTFTDYLDDVSGKYRDENQDPAFANSLEGQLSDKRSLTDRRPGGSNRGGSSSKNDGYIFIQIKAEYTVMKLGSISNGSGWGNKGSKSKSR